MQAIRNPQGDVHPAVFYLSPSGLIRRQKIPWEAFRDRRTKDRMVATIATAAKLTRPDMIAVAWTVWYLQLEYDKLTPGADRAGRGPPRGAPRDAAAQQAP